jgi:phosphoenolpyruvate-protein kinase (PTS system EI component)
VLESLGANGLSRGQDGLAALQAIDAAIAAARRAGREVGICGQALSG